MRRRVLLALGVLASAVLVASPVLATNQYVALRDSKYNPKSVTIKQYDTVFWTHVDPSDVQHSVTAVPGQAEKFDSSPNCPPTCMSRGDTFKHTFTHTGTFAYYCRVHCADNSCAADGMRGTIVVRALNTATPRPTPAPTPTPGHASASVSVTTPVPSPTPTPSPTVAPTPESTTSPAATSVAAPKSKHSNRRGLALGLGIAAVALAALGGALLFLRFRRPT